ncbi:MAG TPA: sulfate ABC transporter substrate-binding protein [Chloroflexota bacterium]|nr:sulfate ABC transporter substrate-binding protein [Chloroflexota bacterium]
MAGLPGAAQAAHTPDSVTLTLVAYSTPAEAYARIIPAFQKTAAGRGVQFHQSYGASGQQSRAVVAGLQADVVAFSLAPDVTRLVTAGLVAKNWNAGPLKGMVTDSIVVLAVRKGNPKHIQTWDDLIKRGIDVITPNPFTSGGARWNIMAAYGAQLRLGRSSAQAINYLKSLFAHVSVQNNSSREELQTFVGGKGDVMIAYENEAITAQRKGAKLDYIVPKQTILIENPIAATSNSAHPAQARAFVSFAQSAAGQRLFGQNGYRPVLSSVASTFHFPTPAQLFTIDSLGGWDKVTKQFFDPQNGIVAQIERGHGVSVG